jgi:predicted nucleic acid-binding protein
MIIDSYAWIEYLMGSEKGKKVNELIKKSECFTLECNLAEIYEWARKNEQDFKFIQKIIISKSSIMPINREDWLKAVDIKLEKRKSIKDFGLIDALIIAKQTALKCKVITGDEHFKNMKEVVYLY